MSPLMADEDELARLALEALTQSGMAPPWMAQGAVGPEPTAVQPPTQKMPSFAGQSFSTVEMPKPTPPRGKFLGLTDTDWMSLAGMLGSPLQIGSPEVRRRGAGIRPFAALVPAAQMLEQHRAAESNTRQINELSALLGQANEDITAQSDPLAQAATRSRWTSRLAPYLGAARGHAQTAGGSRPQSILDFIGGPTTEVLTAAYKAKQEEGDQTSRAGKMQAAATVLRNGGGYLAALEAAGGDKSIIDLLQNQQFLGQARNEGELPTAAPQDVRDFNLRYQALKESLPPGAVQQSTFGGEVSEKGITGRITEGYTDEAKRAAASRGLSPEALKAYQEKTPDAEEQARRELLANRVSQGGQAVLDYNKQPQQTQEQALMGRILNGKATQKDYAVFNQLHPTAEEKARAKAKYAEGKTEKGLSPETRTLSDYYYQILSVKLDPDDQARLLLTAARSDDERAAIAEALRHVRETRQDIAQRRSAIEARQGKGEPSPQQAPVTATGPGGQKLILRNGQWVPYVP